MELAKNYKDEWEIQKKTWNEQYSKVNRLFTKRDGGPIFPDTLAAQYRKIIDRIRDDQRSKLLANDVEPELIEDLLIPNLRFHNIRHTCGTMQKALGETIEDVGAYLGHSDKSSTNIYLHAMLDNQKHTSELMFKSVKKAE